MFFEQKKLEYECRSISARDLKNLLLLLSKLISFPLFSVSTAHRSLARVCAMISVDVLTFLRCTRSCCTQPCLHIASRTNAVGFFLFWAYLVAFVYTGTAGANITHISNNNNQTNSYSHVWPVVVVVTALTATFHLRKQIWHGYCPLRISEFYYYFRHNEMEKAALSSASNELVLKRSKVFIVRKPPSVNDQLAAKFLFSKFECAVCTCCLQTIDPLTTRRQFTFVFFHFQSAALLLCDVFPSARVFCFSLFVIEIESKSMNSNSVAHVCANTQNIPTFSIRRNAR